MRRDPTQPPAAFAAQPLHAADPLDRFRPQQIVSIDGRRYLVWHGRRYAVGDTLEGARIERIEETQVWLRTEQGLRKLKMFAGVEKNNRERMK